MFVILKWVTSAPSLALRFSTMSPDCVSSSVVMFAACGVSPTAVMVMVAFTVFPPRPGSLLDVEAWAVKLPLALVFRDGVNFRPALPSAKLM